MTVAILVPVLGRPHRVKPLLDSIHASTPRPFRVVFICDSADREEQEAILDDGRADLPIMLCSGSYAEKIHTAVRFTHEPLVFTAADDLDFTSGWLEAARAKLTDGVEVVGVNDLLERGREHATHFLMTREYAELPTVDGGPGPFHQGYSHWWCDDELIATAKHRGVYAYAEDSHVEHRHPMNGGAEDDDTYRKGRALARQDRRIFRRRSHLWT